MRNILAMIGAATVAFLVLGWYLGWYQISGLPGPGGKQSVNVEVFPTKAVNDVKKGLERGADVVESFREGGTEPKPAPLTTPQGPASRFFGTPAPATKEGSSGGWKPISPPKDNESAFNFDRPRQ